MRTRTPEQHHAAYNWLTPAEVAARLRIGVGAVRALIRDGHLKALDISRRMA